MPLNPMPPQVSPECDKCGSQLEYDGISLHFDTTTVERDIKNYDWTIVDGKVLCGECLDGDNDA